MRVPRQIVQGCHDREDTSSMVTAGATANTTEGNSRASRESGFVVLTFTRGIYRGLARREESTSTVYITSPRCRGRGAGNAHETGGGGQLAVNTKEL